MITMVVTPFNYAQMASVADQLIQLFGMAASLRRLTDNPTDRACFVAIVDYDPKDRSTELANPTDRVVFLSALYGAIPTEPPDNEQDQLVILTGVEAGKVLPFTAPVKIFAPSGIVCAYKATVRR